MSTWVRALYLGGKGDTAAFVVHDVEDSKRAKFVDFILAQHLGLILGSVLEGRGLLVDGFLVHHVVTQLGSRVAADLEGPVLLAQVLQVVLHLLQLLVRQ